MQNFLVVSYDNDQQQWFYDTVSAENAEDAALLICKIRPYVVAADATDVAELGKLAKRVKAAKPKKIAKQLDAVATESGFTSRCENCGEIYQEDDLEEIRNYSERVAGDEEQPVGQCPAKDCGAVCHLIPS
jgi:hypothetical protein